MPKYELAKTIEARKLNKRTKLPLNEPLKPIPFGAIIEDLEEDRDLARFLHLGELYQCKYEAVVEALRSRNPIPEGPAAASAVSATSAAAVTAAAPAPEAAAEEAPAEEAAGVAVEWKKVGSSHFAVMRAKVPGGWLVSAANELGLGLTFVPDEGHDWCEARQP